MKSVFGLKLLLWICILTLIAGSYGPLIYLVLRELQLAKSKTSAA